MERHLLEEKLRASLAERAGDVESTPVLWQRVEARVGRRARWRVGAVAVGVAALAAVVLAVPGLLRPDGLTVDPDPVTSPTDGDLPTTGDGALAPVVVVAGESSLSIADATGRRTVVADYAGLGEPWSLLDVAVRPGATADDLLVAFTFEVEGFREVAVQRVVDGVAGELWRLGLAAEGAPGVLSPGVEWSDDGAFLAWDCRGCGGHGVALATVNWAQVLDAEDPMGVVAVQSLDEVGRDELRLQDWAGRPAEVESRLLFTTASFELATVRVAPTLAGACELGGQALVDPTCLGVVVAGSEVRPLEAGAVVDVTDAGSHVYALVARAEQPGDAEGAVLHLVQDPDADTQREVVLPAELTTGTASPGDAWLASDAGGPLLVGRGGQAWALYLPDEDADADLRGVPIEPQVVALGEDAVAAALGHPGASVVGEPGDGPSDDATEPEPLAVGLPSGVVVRTDTGLALVERVDGTADGRVVVEIGAPEGLPDREEWRPWAVAVHPDSTLDRVDLIATWNGLGESTAQVHTRIVDGEVVVHEALPYSGGGGGISVITGEVPVFDPFGEHVAWTIFDGEDGYELLVFPWDDGPRIDRVEIVPLQVPGPVDLRDWSADPGATEDLLTFTGYDEDDTTDVWQLAVRRTYTAEGTDPIAWADAAWSTLAVPGRVLAIGSWLYEDGSARWAAWVAGGEVVVATLDRDGALGDRHTYRREGPPFTGVAFGPDVVVLHVGELGETVVAGYFVSVNEQLPTGQLLAPLPDWQVPSTA